MKVLNMIFYFSFLFSCYGSVLASDRIYYVTPVVDGGGTCDVGGAVLEPCLPLTNFTPEILTSNDDSQHLNITMLFLPGEHLISSQYKLSSSNVDTFMMLPYNESGNATVSITCAGTGTLSMNFVNVKVLKVLSIKVSSCALQMPNAAALFTVKFANTITVRDCYFKNNSAAFILKMENASSLDISGCTFTSNGPKLRSYNISSIKASNTSSLNNRVNETGGALYAQQLSTVEIINCVFSNSIAGALLVKTSYLLVNNSCFSYNKGGTLNISNSENVEMNAVNFTNNKAIRNGGAISAQNNSLISLNNCVFSNNTSQQSAGAFQVTKGRRLTINNSFFSSNRGNSGGALGISHCENVILNDVRLANNRAKQSGGAIYVEGSTIKALHNSPTTIYINSNTAGTYGGGIMLTYSSILDFTKGTLYIARNTARYEGGGAMLTDSSILYCSNGTIYIYKNRAGSYGGGIKLYSSSLLLSNSSLYIKNNTAGFRGGGIRVTGSSTLNLSSCTLSIDSNTGIYGGGVMLSGNSSTLEFSNGIFCISNNTAKKNGSGIILTSSVTLALSNSTLEIDGNKAQNNGGGVLLNGKSKLKLSNSTICISNNTAGNSGGGVMLNGSSRLDFSNSTLHIYKNRASYGGGIKLYSSSLLLYNSSLYIKNNTAKFRGGGIRVTGSSTLNLSSCTLSIDSNTGLQGGGVILSFSSTLEFSNGIFCISNNTAKKDGSGIMLTSSATLVLSNSTLDIDGNKAQNNGGGVLLVGESKLDLSNSTICISNNTAGNSGGGVMLTDISTFELSGGTILNLNSNKAGISGGGYKLNYESALELSSGTLCVDNNTAGNSGGGVALDDRAYLKLYGGSDIHFSNNGVTAKDGKGGAIFVSNNCNDCPIVHVPNNSSKKYLHFSNNYAANGSILYGGLDKCWRKNSMFNLIESEPVLDLANLTYARTSNVTLCFCENKKPNCRLQREKSIPNKYPGQNIGLSVIPFNQLHEPVSSTIEYHCNDCDHVYFRIHEESQNVPAKCQDVKFHVYSYLKHFRSGIELVIGTNNDNRCINLKRLTINFVIEPCPFGFELSEGKCICDKRLAGILEKCDIKHMTGKIRSKSNGWFEYDEKYLKMNEHYCPLNYCIRNKNNTISFLHSQCADNRVGVLCGACADNYSIGLGSWRCLQCTNSQYNFIWLGPLIATAGVVLVALLLLLKLTVSSGTINGLVFYANVISVSQLTNLPNCSINPAFSVFVSWINLDFGIEACFYSGMDTYQKIWLQFVFPLYIWFIVGIIIIVCHYSSRVMKLMGKRCIDILATLFLLSYAKLFKTIITAVSFVDITTSKADNVSDSLVPYEVWTYDGNVDYLTGKHLPLFVVALFFLVFLFLPYTLLLTFGQCLRSLPRKRGLRWVQSMAFISIMDAYHAPYNKRHRYWTGLALLTRCVLFTIFAANTHNILITNMFTTVIITSLLLVIRLLATYTVYRNYFIDKLDLSFLFNLEFLAATVYYLEGVGEYQAHCRVTTVSIAFAFITFLGIVFYHLYLQIRGTRSYKNVVTKLSNYKYIQKPVAAGDTSTSSSHSTSFIELRESLLASTFD